VRPPGVRPAGDDRGQALEQWRSQRLRRVLFHPLRHPIQLVVVGFLAVIAVGTLLLWLPVATRDGNDTGLHTAFFTATSATCVTGLTLVDTAAHWSPFGQAVVMVLMQVGGLGLMTFASLLALVTIGQLGLHSRMLAQVEAKWLDGPTVRRFLLSILKFSLVVEALVWVALTWRFWSGYDEPAGRAAYLGLFHAVSAFNNAGFTLWDDSLTGFGADPLVLLPVAFAFVLGGIGYPVIMEARRSLRPQRWSLHTKLTVVTTLILLVLGPLVVVLTEVRAGGTLDTVDWTTRLLSGWFTGVAPRTAGFAAIDYSRADPATLMVTDILMAVGGGSAGTAGGIKVTTLAVLVLAVVSELRGDPDVRAFRRRVVPSTVRQALAVVVLGTVIVSVASFVLLELTAFELDQVLFEVVSAFGTVGLTTGITRQLPTAGQDLLIVLMIIGRLGPITVATALALRGRRRLFRYAEARPIVG
jgi:trk system potassium uptake protein TrkH